MVCKKCLKQLGHTSLYLATALEQDSKVAKTIRTKLIAWANGAYGEPEPEVKEREFSMLVNIENVLYQILEEMKKERLT